LLRSVDPKCPQGSEKYKKKLLTNIHIH